MDIQIPNLPLETILIGSDEVTAEIIVDLDKKKIYAGIVTLKHMKIESYILNPRITSMTNQLEHWYIMKSDWYLRCKFA